MLKKPIKVVPGKRITGKDLDAKHSPTANEKKSTGGDFVGKAKMARHDGMFGKTAKKPENDDRTLRKSASSKKRATEKRLTQVKI